jgi:hypothetical protein
MFIAAKPMTYYFTLQQQRKWGISEEVIGVWKGILFISEELWSLMC